MEAVDVLGDDAAQLSRRLQLGQLLMGGVGLGPGIEHLVPVEAEKLLRVGVKEAAAEHGLRGEFVVLIVEAVGAPEILNS